MKYIREKSTIVIFSDDLVHAEVAKQLRMKPDSAGFLSIEVVDEKGGTRARCYGESISLDIKSDPEKDSELADYHLGIRHPYDA